MASLMEELVSTLEQEETLYGELVPIAEEKTRVIVKNDLETLQKVTEQEQLLVDRAANLEKKRQEVVSNIAIVMSRDVQTLNLQAIVDMLQKQPEEQKKLKLVHDRLKKTVGRLKDINVQNKLLIEDSLEMVEFNMNYIRSTRMSSGSSNYNKNAAETDSGVYYETGVFDAKQ